MGGCPQEILDHLVELMMDPFGNYLIQKLLDRCSEEQRLQVGRAGRGWQLGLLPWSMPAGQQQSLQIHPGCQARLPAHKCTAPLDGQAPDRIRECSLGSKIGCPLAEGVACAHAGKQTIEVGYGS